MGLLDNGVKPGEQGYITDIPCNYCFYKLFIRSTGIRSVSENFLRATTLANYCYDSMLQNCSSLTTSPELLATDLADSCYDSMFQSYSSLISIKIGYTGNYNIDYFYA